MIVADGQEWQRTHDALMPLFTPAYVAAHYAPVIEMVAAATFDQLTARHSTGAADEVEVEPLMRAMLARVMGFVVFGGALEADEARELHERLDAVTPVIPERGAACINLAFAAFFRLLDRSERQPFLIPRPQRDAIDALLAWIGRKIETARSRGTDMPLVDALERRFAPSDASALRHCVATECAMLFTAGIETTAAALTFALAEIADEPALQARIAAEARQQQSPLAAGKSATVRFPLIHCVVQESLRRHTIVPTMLREAADDCRVHAEASGAGEAASLAIKRGSTLRYLLIHGHMRRGIWENPHAFDPGRFGRPLSHEQRRNYNPFGLGPQSCLGRHMAMVEATISLQALFQRLNVEHKKLSGEITVRRNALFTNRPVGVKLRFVTVTA
jgi:cytochrome P450